ncbi:molybdenum cofactor guanylyltransferase [Saccharibacillus sacchari]|uniref:Molybdenum cofactor guanylyltransferase n=1 Tax=Saccharibacillus sacchari TaxID=456493 RepID=A0ACC6PH50_9BACL
MPERDVNGSRDRADDLPTIGILLAGGLSRRFGSPKAFAIMGNPKENDNRMFYQRSLDALGGVCDSTVIVTSRELQHRFPSELKICTDLPHIAGQGPLAGICTAMREYPDSRYIVMACDMPSIGPDEVRGLNELAAAAPAADVVAVRTPDAAIPLFSVWRHDVSIPLEKAVLAGQLGVMKMLERLHTCWIDSAALNPDEDVFRNHNTADDSDQPPD